MANGKQSGSSKRSTLMKPSSTLEGRQNQLIAMAYNEAERRIADGTATSQLLCHFLSLGTEKYKLANEKLRAENRLAEAKTKAIESEETKDALYQNAIAAMKRYSGYDDGDDDE